MVYFGHIVRHDGMVKQVLEAHIPWKRSRGRPRCRWNRKTLFWGSMEKATILRYSKLTFLLHCHKGNFTMTRVCCDDEDRAYSKNIQTIHTYISPEDKVNHLNIKNKLVPKLVNAKSKSIENIEINSGCQCKIKIL